MPTTQATDTSNGQTMTAVYASGGDGNSPLSMLKVGTVAQPTVPAGWVRVKMAAAAINYFDFFVLGGYLGDSITYPRIIGCEGTGYLDDGTPVLLYPVIRDEEYYGDETLDPKRQVLPEKLSGTFAEYVAVPRRNVVHRPAELDNVSGAVLGGAWLTAYRMIFSKSGLKPGQIMLVQGSSGGVATALIQLGSAAGMRVWVTSRTVEKRNLGIELGAEQAFAPGEPLPSQVDAVFDIAGEPTWAHSLASVKMGGSILLCGAHGGINVSMDLGEVVGKQVSIHGTYIGTLQEFKDLIQFVIAKRISPKIGKAVPVANAFDAFKAMAEGQANGKLVITF